MLYIHFNNRKEFEALMNHFQEKGWKHQYGQLFAWPEIQDRKIDLVQYKDSYLFGTKGATHIVDDNLDILSFHNWTSLVGIEVKPTKEEHELSGNTTLILTKDEVVFWHEAGGGTLTTEAFIEAIAHFNEYHK